MTNTSKIIHKDNQQVLNLENLAKLRKGDAVTILYAKIPTEMIYYGKSHNDNDIIQLIEVPKLQDYYSTFSIYAVKIQSLFYSGKAELYPGAEKLPRRVIQGDSEYNAINNMMKEHDSANNRIIPPMPKIESDKRAPLSLKINPPDSDMKRSKIIDDLFSNI